MDKQYCVKVRESAYISPSVHMLMCLHGVRVCTHACVLVAGWSSIIVGDLILV